MGIQQMLLRSLPALSLTISGSAIKDEFRFEPAEATITLSTDLIEANVLNAIATPIYSWTYVSGDSTIYVSSTNAKIVMFIVQIDKNTIKSAIWRCTVTVDGTTLSQDIEVVFSYTTSV